MNCPKCQSSLIIKKGKINTRKKGKKTQRFACKTCHYLFTQRSFLKQYREKKPRLNSKIEQLYLEGVSLRGISRYLKCDYKTVLRKFEKRSEIAKKENQKEKLSNIKKLKIIQLSELSTYVQSKRQPIYITLAVSNKAHILSCKSNANRDIALSQMMEDISSYVSNKSIFYFNGSKTCFPVLDKYYPNTDYLACVGKDKSLYLQQSKFICLLIKNRLARINKQAWSFTKKTTNLQLNLELFQFNFNQKMKRKEQRLKMAEWIKEPFDSIKEDIEIKQAG